ncbi:MAG: GntR family transcriptional regulator [Solirubrobacterales bacterium]|nr:GntR family transcriptional regulator [Solirubrobacterales bacterium]MBV8940725.1 GntR family transcriptional regulator [Solirubrobacterales bacterium]
MTQLPAVEIDRESPVPFYFQLAELLEQEITSGHWGFGTRIPSEPELCEHYRLSRTTIRQALAWLEQRGLIDRRKGRGTFVRRGDSGLWLLQSSEGFFQDEVDRAGRTVTSRVLHAGRGPLPSWACDALELPDRSEGATLERLRLLDGAVALYVINHLPERLADAALAITNPNESLYRRLRERSGVVPYGGRRTLEAVRVEEWLATLLELEPGDPVAFIRSVGWDEELRPFDTYRAWLRTDRTRIDIQVSGLAAAVTHPLSVQEEKAS